uniref:Protein krueppel n=1 Tax=Anopheles coluzzii TaxID=1518534 RepID=A0A6E8W9F0_ANOCL
MVHTLRKITNICRLCLCEELDILVPAEDVFDSSLTTEDVERFTGVQIPADDKVPYVICTDCRSSLRKSAAFRKSCVRNDRLYCQLFSELIVEIRNETNRKQPATIVHHTPDDDIDVTVFTHPVHPKQLSASENKQLVSADERDLESIETEATPLKSTLSSPRPEPMAIDETSNLQDPPIRTRKRRKKYANRHVEYLCDICGQTTTNYKRHQLTHTKEVRIPCPHCPIQMTDSSNLARHIEAVHMQLIIKTCELCGKGFKHHNSYNAHMRGVHNVGEKYKCKICYKEFNSTRSIQEHTRRRHSIETKFECKDCSKRFKCGRSLYIHKRVHSDNRPYACSHCPKRFKSSFGRNTHQLTHTGIIFSCQHCDKSYRYKAQLNMHMRKLHPELFAENTDGSGGPD